MCSESRLRLGLNDRDNETNLISSGDFGLTRTSSLNVGLDDRNSKTSLTSSGDFGLTRTLGLNGESGTPIVPRGPNELLLSVGRIVIVLDRLDEIFFISF